MCQHCCHCYGLWCLLDLGVVVDKGGVQALGHLGVVVDEVSVHRLWVIFMHRGKLVMVVVIQHGGKFMYSFVHYFCSFVE